jgi:hypothetical protein
MFQLANEFLLPLHNLQQLLIPRLHIFNFLPVISHSQLQMPILPLHQSEFPLLLFLLIDFYRAPRGFTIFAFFSQLCGNLLLQQFIFFGELFDSLFVQLAVFLQVVQFGFEVFVLHWGWGLLGSNG